MDALHDFWAFRRALPVAQLLICLIALWPSRYFITFDVLHAMRPNFLSTLQAKPGAPIDFEIPVLTPEQQQAADKASKREALRMEVPVMLNFPAIIVQLPYIVLSPAKREWVPGGILPEMWRALTWPLAGILFWWCVGRGLEALRAARRGLLLPRMTLVETVFSAILVCIGFASVVGILTSTPDDRRDTQFVMLVAGGVLCGLLASFTVIARILQWRIAKRMIATPALP